MAGSLAALIPTPLHPAIVHLPMALAVLLPVFAVVGFLAVKRGARPMRTWAVALAMFGALTASGWASMQTGEQEEDRVESVVPRAAFHAHEEAAELFVWLSAGVFGIAAIGLLSTGIGSAARGVATIGSLVLLVAGYRVGHSGGALVYTHGAASAYATGATAGAGGAAGDGSSLIGRSTKSAESGGGRAEGDDDDDDDAGGSGSAEASPAGAASDGATAGVARAGGSPLSSHRAVPLDGSVPRP